MSAGEEVGGGQGLGDGVEAAAAVVKAAVDGGGDGAAAAAANGCATAAAAGYDDCYDYSGDSGDSGVCVVVAAAVVECGGAGCCHGEVVQAPRHRHYSLESLWARLVNSKGRQRQFEDVDH